MREFVVVSSINPVSVAKEDGVKGIKVSGTAVSHAGGKPNMNGLIYPIETIKQFASSLSGYPMVIDHENTIAKTVGRVTNSYEKNGDLMDESDINEEHPSGIGKMLERKDVDSVSIMAMSNNIECTICAEPFGLCPHQPLKEYDKKIAAGIVHHLKWKHLSFVLDPADPYASDTKVASQNENVQGVNDKLMVDICQQFIDAKNENQENIIKQNVKIMSSEENKVSQKEVETLLKTATKEKDFVIKEKETEVKQKDTEIATLLKQMEEIKAKNETFETKEKDKLISQICELSGEKPEEYSDMNILQLERLHKSVVAYDKKFGRTEEGQEIDQSGKFAVGQPPKQPVYDEAEEGVKLVQHLFNLKALPIEDDAKTIIRFISQSERIQDGVKIRGDK